MQDEEGTLRPGLNLLGADIYEAQSFYRAYPSVSSYFIYFSICNFFNFFFIKPSLHGREITSIKHLADYSTSSGELIIGVPTICRDFL